MTDFSDSDTASGSDDADLANVRQTTDAGIGADQAFLTNPQPGETGRGSDDAHVTKFATSVASACGPYSGPVTIRYDGIDITSCVIFADANFKSQANGAVGTCVFRVKDAAHSFSFVTGRSLELEIEGSREWGGFVSQVRYGFFFVGSEQDPTETARYFEISGVDYNVLFQKRVIYDKAVPTNTMLTAFPPDTDDDVVLKHYVANHMDLAGDGLSSSGIEHVGSPSLDDIISGSAGWTWGDLNRYVRFNTGALDYIDPDRVIIHTDVDTPNVGFILADQIILLGDGSPDPGYVQYREVMIDHDGGGLRNEAFAWGLGQGSALAVFSHLTDSTSIADHGLWQVGRVLSQVWRQNTVDRIVDSLINGSPQSKRGGKDDQLAIECVVFRPGFRVGQKVEVVSAVWNVDQVLPIRTVEIDFPVPASPRYRLVLSHEIDDPWSSMDPFQFDFPLPPVPMPDFNMPTIAIPPFQNFTVIDSFDDRILHNPFAIGWGYASGYPSYLWTSVNGEVYNGNGWSLQAGEDSPVVQEVLPDYDFYSVGLPWIGLWKISSPYSNSTNVQFQIQTMFATLPDAYCYVDVGGINTVAEYFVMVWLVEESGQLRVRARQWLVWDPDPGVWDVDTLIDIPGFFKLYINCAWVGPYAGLGGGIFRVDYVWQLSDTVLPTGLAATYARGQTCETPYDRSAPPGYPGGDTYFGIRSAYVPHTTRLWADGVLLRKGVDYGEGDPYYGPFLHVTVDVSGKKMYVCYDAIIGGS